MATLTPRKAQVYKFIVSFKSEHDGNSPSITEIGKACEINSTSYVSGILQELQTMGLIRCNYDGGKPRMIEVVGGQWIAPKPRKITEADARKLIPIIINQPVER